MQEYRTYILGRDGHIQSRVDIICANDEAAKKQAKQLVDGHDVELWQLDHRIAEFLRRRTKAVSVGGLYGRRSRSACTELFKSEQ